MNRRNAVTNHGVSTEWAGGVREEPHVYAVDMEAMVTLRQQEHRLIIFKVREANGAVQTISICRFVDDGFERSDD